MKLFALTTLLRSARTKSLASLTKTRHTVMLANVKSTLALLTRVRNAGAQLRRHSEHPMASASSRRTLRQFLSAMITMKCSLRSLLRGGSFLRPHNGEPPKERGLRQRR